MIVARGRVGEMVGRLRGKGEGWRDGTSSSGGEASRGERLRPINRAGYWVRRSGREAGRDDAPGDAARDRTAWPWLAEVRYLRRDMIFWRVKNYLTGRHYLTLLVYT